VRGVYDWHSYAGEKREALKKLASLINLLLPQLFSHLVERMSEPPRHSTFSVAFARYFYSYCVKGWGGNHAFGTGSRERFGAELFGSCSLCR